MSDTPAKVARRRGLSAISPIWLLPLVAVALGAWMVVFTYRNQGPTITSVFPTAEGLEAGKTKVKARSVEVGLVSDVRLGDDHESVEVDAEIELGAAGLLREDTQFWVVRPRVGSGGISGLGTLVSGAYLELAPGSGRAGVRDFIGLADIPVTPVGAPGLKLTLLTEIAGSVGPGDDILYNGFRVGRVESATFDVESGKVRHDAFIEAPYDALVTERTRFWNASGLHFSATADGIKLSTGSLQSLLLGGVAFGVPDGRRAGDRVENGATFRLYSDEESARERRYRHSLEYVVRFSTSIRGLSPGAPVEYRGLRAGRVERVLLEELADAGGGSGRAAPIPVLITVEPGRLEMGDDEEGVARLRRGIEVGVGNGLRATLASGNLLTGSLLIALDRYDDVEPATLGEFAGRPTIPTISSGLEGIERRVATLLDKLNALPLEEATVSAADTLDELNRTAASLNAVLKSGEVQALPFALESTLAELDRTLRQVRELAESLEEQPSSLLFAREPKLDPEPPARSP
jgi:paraquat-inducible protein B